MLSKTLRNLTFYYPNQDEFDRIYKEIFKEHLYYVELDTQRPYIIDCGGHVGVSALFFKTFFPQAEVMVFEPLPSLLPYLYKNLEENQLDDIEVVEKALWSFDGQVKFYVDSQLENHWPSTSSVINGAWTTRQETKPQLVPCVRLSRYLHRPVDVLKIDIEGAETVVLQEARGQLHHVRHVFVEFHATTQHRPDQVLDILRFAGFTISVYCDSHELDSTKLHDRRPTLYMIEGTR